ncbi:hypothetical protein GWI33_014034 [Rhynchophorus ferrugineus]|uniref:Uncharacterized protein n=1 Tax=Rhynchophorus ferrugineus TaxID=354439 RepID=A0A834M796_RHYFE|nr:hypothetical protein GWI33_014034 [Rhynchophorus ferrugineus]
MSFARAERFHDESGEILPFTHQNPIKNCNRQPTWMKLNANDAVHKCKKNYKHNLNRAISENNNMKKRKLHNKRTSEYIPINSDRSKSKSEKMSVNTRLRLSDCRAPSFMTRPKIIHRCVSNTPKRPDSFQRRHSIKRKSLRITKQTKDDKLVSENIDRSRPIEKPMVTEGEIPTENLLNLSNNALRTTKDESNQIRPQIRRDRTFIVENKVVPEKKTEKLETSVIDESELDDDSIVTPLTDSLEYLDLSDENEAEPEKKFDLQQFLEERRSRASETERWVTIVTQSLLEAKTFLGNDLSEADDPDQVSVVGNFIDDEYDSYLDSNGMATLRDIGTDNLYHICNSLVSSYSSKGTKDSGDELQQVNEERTPDRNILRIPSVNEERTPDRNVSIRQSVNEERTAARNISRRLFVDEERTPDRNISRRLFVDEEKTTDRNISRKLFGKTLNRDLELIVKTVIAELKG